MKNADAITIAIVEDHVMVAEALAAALDAADDLVVVGTAGTVAEARRLAADDQPDVVLMDLMLPDGDGAAATAEVRRVAPSTRVVLISSANGQDVLARAIEAGCSGMLSKTEPVAQLRAAIRRVGTGEAVFVAEDLAGMLRHLGGRDQGVAALTGREKEVLELLAQGLGTQAIAAELVLSLHTVRNHVRNLLMKLGAHSRLEAVAIGLREGLVTAFSRADQQAG